MIEGFGPCERHDPPLSAPGHGAGNVERRCGVTSTRKDELAQRRKRILELIDRPLQDVNVLGRDGRDCCSLSRQRRREFGSQVKEPILDGLHKGHEVRVREPRAGCTEVGVQFVNGTIRLDARIIFGDPPTADETRLPLVSSAGVNSNAARSGSGRAPALA